MGLKDQPDATTVIRGSTQQPESKPEDFQVASWDRYRILECLGEGGMGRVYKAVDPTLNRHVAIKFLHGTDPSSQRRFLSEARSQAQIEHPHVCKIHEVGAFEGKNYIAMQFISGERLDKLRSQLTVEQKASIGLQLAEALQAAHRLGIIHRDIKPANILVEKQDSGWCSYLVDFGLARDTSVPGTTKSGVVMGTPEYMSPEQAWGNPEEVDRRSDIYSLGATLYDLFTQNPPFEGNSFEVLMKLAQDDPVPLRKKLPHLARDLETIVMKCLEKDSDRRYESARSLADDLRRYLDGEPIAATPVSRSYRLLRKVRKHRTAISIVALSILLAGIFGTAGIYSWWRTEKQLQLTRQITETVESMEWQMRVEHTMPLHDIRKAKTQIKDLMKSIQQNLMSSGNIAYGPAQYALGRGFMTLGDIKASELHLKKAWNSGYDRPEVAHALGLTLGAVFERQLESVRNREETPEKQQESREVQRKYRDPALKYLNLGQQAKSSTPEYVLALSAFYQEKYPEALKNCERALDRTPWLYEIKILEGKIYTAMADRVLYKDTDKGISHYLQAQEAFRQASTVGASDPEVYIRMCDVGRAIMQNSFYNKGVDARNIWEQIERSCENALKVDPENAMGYAKASAAQQDWSYFQGFVGEDPRPAIQKSIRAARQATELEPNNFDFLKGLGDAYLYFMTDASPRGIPLQETVELAIRSYLKAAETEPSEDLFNNLAFSYWYQAIDQMDRGENAMSALEDSIRTYQKAIKIAPNFVQVHANLIWALSTKAEYELERGIDPNSSIQAAIDIYQKSLKINQKFPLAMRNVSEAYLIRGRHQMISGMDPRANFEMAFDLGQKAQKLNPGMASNFYSGIAKRYQAQYEREQGTNAQASLEEARKILEGIAVQKIEYAPFYLEPAEVYLEQAKHLQLKKKSSTVALDKAEKYLDRAFQINPNYSWSHLTRGKLYLMKAAGSGSTELFSKAEDAFRRAIQIKPDQAEAHCLLAKAQTQQAAIEKDPARRAARLRDAENFLSQGLSLNRFLEREYQDSKKQLPLLKKQS